MAALPQIQCQQHDHARQYDNDGACHNKRNGGKLHGNISRNGYGNAIIGRYGGCVTTRPQMVKSLCLSVIPGSVC